MNSAIVSHPVLVKWFETKRDTSGGAAGLSYSGRDPAFELVLPAVALCSNKATETQTARLEQLARKASQSRLILMPDNDEEGEAGFKDLLWAPRQPRPERPAGVIKDITRREIRGDAAGRNDGSRLEAGVDGLDLI